MTRSWRQRSAILALFIGVGGLALLSATAPASALPTETAPATAPPTPLEDLEEDGDQPPSTSVPLPPMTPSPNPEATDPDVSPDEVTTEAPVVPPAPTSTPAPAGSPTATPASTEPTQTSVPVRPAVPPAASQSSVPTLSVVLALLVLGAAIVAVRRLGFGEADMDNDEARTAPTLVDPLDAQEDASASGTLLANAATATDPVGPSPAPPWNSDEPSTLTFLVELGRALLDAGSPVTQVGLTLRQVADTNGVSHAAVVVLPTALFVSFPGSAQAQTSVTSAGTTALSLRQIDDVFRIVDDALASRISPGEGLQALTDARESTGPFTPLQRLAGYTLLTAGLVLILRGNWWDLVVASVLGTLVGALQLRTTRVPRAYQVFLPIVSSFTVALAVLLLARSGLDVGIYAAIIAPLVTLLPGALLTTAVIELATGQMMSGAGRLAAGAMQLVLLALGIITAAQLVGVPATTITGASPDALGVLAAWLGVAVFGVGAVLARGARVESIGWILLILYVAFAGQLIGGVLLGSQLSAFAGAVAMTPVAMYVATQRTGPPTLVTFLPAFWLLVPGAIGLAGVTKYLGADRLDGALSIITAGTTMIAIALGVLIGLAVGTLLGVGEERGTANRGKRVAG